MFAMHFSYVCEGLRRLATRQVRCRAMSVILPFVTVPVLVGLPSCAAHRVAALGDPKLEDAMQAHRVRVAGYTTSDGHYRRFDGYVIQTADSLVFLRPATPTRFVAAGSPERVFSLPRQQVQSVTLEKLSVTRTVLLCSSVLGLFALAVVAGGGLGPFVPF